MKQNTEPVEKNNKTKSWILDYINKIYITLTTLKKKKKKESKNKHYHCINLLRLP